MRRLDLDKLRGVLLDSVLEHQPIQTMFHRIYDCIELPLNCFDTSFRLIANALERPFYFPPWEHMAEHLGATEEEVINQRYLDYQEVMYAAGRSQIFDYGTCEGFPQACGPVMTRGKLVGYMGTMIEDAEPEDVIEANDLISAAIALLVRDQQARWDPEFDLQEFDVEALLTSGLPEGQAAAFQKRYPPPYFYIIFTSDSAGVSTLHFVQDRLCTEKHGMLGLIRHGSYLLLLKYGVRHPLRPGELVAQLEPFTKQLMLFCGVSDCFGSAAQIGTFRAQAEAALSVGAGKKGRPGVFTFREEYRDIVQMAILERFGGHASLDPRLRPLLGAEVPYLETLEAYLEGFGRVASAAKVLATHKNTVMNRLERIKDMTGLELGEPEREGELALQLDLLRLSAALRIGPEGGDGI